MNNATLQESVSKALIESLRSRITQAHSDYIRVRRGRDEARNEAADLRAELGAYKIAHALDQERFHDIVLLVQDILLSECVQDEITLATLRKLEETAQEPTKK